MNLGKDTRFGLTESVGRSKIAVLEFSPWLLHQGTQSRIAMVFSETFAEVSGQSGPKFFDSR